MLGPSDNVWVLPSNKATVAKLFISQGDEFPGKFASIKFDERKDCTLWTARLKAINEIGRRPEWGLPLALRRIWDRITADMDPTIAMDPQIIFGRGSACFSEFCDALGGGPLSDHQVGCVKGGTRSTFVCSLLLRMGFSWMAWHGGARRPSCEADHPYARQCLKNTNDRPSALRLSSLRLRNGSR